MVADSAILTSTLAPPKSFAALMSLYESNYLRLSWIIDSLDRLGPAGSEYQSEVPGDCCLFLTVCDVSPYTSTLHLTYRFEEAGERVCDPDLSVRVYRDARLAEAMACGGRRCHPALTNFDTNTGAELRRRWTRNIMLNKWLEYCADRGHGFSMGTSVGEAPTGGSRPSTGVR
ncbi:MAG: DUF1249 domain-containing protein [Pseudomonadota bacterium]